MKRKRALFIAVSVIAILVLAVILLNLVARPAASHPFFLQFEEYPLVIAHSDSTGLGIAPGDTLLFLEEAAELGVDVLEMNVHMTADGEIVLIHDDTVDSTTNGSGKVAEMNLAEIQELEVGVNWTQDGGVTYPYRGAGLRIPTLDEVFQSLTDYPMNIEIKSDSTASGERLCGVIKEYDRDLNVLIASSRDEALEAFRTACPEVATSAHRGEVTEFVLLSYGMLANPSEPGFSAFQVPVRSSGILIMRPGFIQAAHRRDLQVHVWTIDDPAEMQRYIDMGVDGIITNRPAQMMAMLER